MLRKPETKTCGECGETKPVTEFYKASGQAGYRSKCKDCYIGPGRGLPPGPKPVPVLERFEEDEYGCWLWTGAIGKHGYGTVKWEGVTRMAHRVVWTLFRGEIPAGMVLDHLCEVKNCVNPDHLEPVTHAVNIQRAWDRRHCATCRCQEDNRPTPALMPAAA